MDLTLRERFEQLTDDEIEGNIKSREEVLPKLVGNLYPHVVNDELAVLRKIQSERHNSKN